MANHRPGFEAHAVTVHRLAQNRCVCGPRCGPRSYFLRYRAPFSPSFFVSGMVARRKTGSHSAVLLDCAYSQAKVPDVSVAIVFSRRSWRDFGMRKEVRSLFLCVGCLRKAQALGSGLRASFWYRNSFLSGDFAPLFRSTYLNPFLLVRSFHVHHRSGRSRLS